MPTNKELQKRIEELEALIERAMGLRTRQRPAPVLKREERADYIKIGSPEHMEWLGLRKAKPLKKDENGEEVEDPTQYKGYEMADITLYGVTVRPEYLRSVLVQKVNELTLPTPAIQSVDPTLPYYAQPLWIPNDIPVRGIV